MNLLFVIHNWIDHAPYGGTEIHVLAITQALTQINKHLVYVLFPDVKIASECNNYLLLNIKDKTVIQVNLTYPVSADCYSHQELSSLFESLIIQYKIDIVHFFHLLRFPLNLPLIALKAGAKTVVSFFDYYLICRQFNFLKKDNSFCGYPNITIQTCDLCLKQHFNSQAGTQYARRNFISQVLYHVDAVHYLCQDQYQRINIAYRHLQNKTSIIMGLGIGAPLNSDFSKENILERLNEYVLPLKVACVGNFDTNKGAQLIIQVIDYYQSIQQNIEFHIYGDVREPYSNILSEMANKNLKSLKLYGQYTPQDLPKLLQHCHVALFASTWPETFVLALSEVWSCGLIPVAPDIGAFRERIAHGRNGFLYNLKDCGSLITVLDSFLKMSARDFQNLLQGVNRVRYPLLESNINQYLSLYESLLQKPTNLNTVELISRVQIEHHVRAYLEIQPSEIQLSEIQQSNEAQLPVVPTPENSHLLYKAWQYYKRSGLLSTIKRSIKYTWQR
ncbi:putative glycosyl transferase [Calothrix sp. NIES-4071]|nr:putative glycosyl transferase [Calothrix sp. NIES-4071]BAZ56066.1 putative glycosyl transferase [Calothrix sp. NIES-4105]